VDEIKEIYSQRVEEISPNIRFCAYNIGDESAINDLMQMRLKSGQDDGITSRLDVSNCGIYGVVCMDVSM
jgi:signal recognition particle subunit SRP68